VVRIEKALDQQETALGVFLDIEGAFSNTSYDSICAELARHGVSHTIIRWIRATLVGRLATAALGAIRTMSQLVRQYQEALNDISARHAVGLYWVPWHAEVRGNETANELMRNGSASGFVGSEPALGVSRQDLRNKISR
jgi:hypothetical protein